MKNHSSILRLVFYSAALPIVTAAMVSAGCSFFKKNNPPAPAGVTGNSNNTINASKKVDDSNRKVDSLLIEQASKLKANVDAARTENQNNPDGNPKTIVDMELGIAQERLKTVEADPVEIQRALQAKALVEAGKAEEARKTAAIASSEASKLASEITKAKTERDLAVMEKNQAQAVFQKELEANRLKNQKTLDDLLAKHREELDAERKSFMKMMGRVLVGLGAILVLVGVFVVYAGVQSGNVLKSGVKAGVFAGGAAFCFACAWTINQPWFKWVVIGGGSLAILGVVGYLWSEWKENRRFIEADEAEDTLKKISKVIDDLPRDNPIFQKLSKTMDASNKALVLELKAEDRRAKTI